MSLRVKFRCAFFGLGVALQLLLELSCLWIMVVEWPNTGVTLLKLLLREPLAKDLRPMEPMELWLAMRLFDCSIFCITSPIRVLVSERPGTARMLRRCDVSFQCQGSIKSIGERRQIATHLNIFFMPSPRLGVSALVGEDMVGVLDARCRR